MPATKSLSGGHLGEDVVRGDQVGPPPVGDQRSWRAPSRRSRRSSRRRVRAPPPRRSPRDRCRAPERPAGRSAGADSRRSRRARRPGCRRRARSGRSSPRVYTRACSTQESEKAEKYAYSRKISVSGDVCLELNEQAVVADAHVERIEVLDAVELVGGQERLAERRHARGRRTCVSSGLPQIRQDGSLDHTGRRCARMRVVRRLRDAPRLIEPDRGRLSKSVLLHGQVAVVTGAGRGSGGRSPRRSPPPAQPSRSSPAPSARLDEWPSTIEAAGGIGSPSPPTSPIRPRSRRSCGDREPARRPTLLVNNAETCRGRSVRSRMPIRRSGGATSRSA